ncbi:hypothetical protein [Segetibacter koreensis]|uniref:hypothetical protein n=1 Tax=Segetibacter koreensis TaxID=398037 RepID=UPI0003792130|nr:hypothetical protein [Segetibacter koreensis]
MNLEITASNFYNLWYETTEAQKELLLNSFRNNTGFTNLIFHSEEAVLKKIADKLEMNCYTKNYYSLDAIFYTDDDLVPCRPPNSYWFRNIQIAFEHENFFGSGLYQEVSHLLITNCKMRVLVTYRNGDEKMELDKLHAVIKGVPQSQNIADRESFLIIFGYENNFQWKGYIYKNEGWQLLANPTSEELLLSGVHYL